MLSFYNEKKYQSDLHTMSLIKTCIIQKLIKLEQSLIKVYESMKPETASKIKNHILELIHLLENRLKFNTNFTPKELYLMNKLREWFAIEGKSIPAFDGISTIIGYVEPLWHYNYEQSSFLQIFSLSFLKDIIDQLEVEKQLHVKTECGTEFEPTFSVQEKVREHFFNFFDSISDTLIKIVVGQIVSEAELKMQAEFKKQLTWLTMWDQARFQKIQQNLDTWLELMMDRHVKSPILSRKT